MNTNKLKAYAKQCEKFFRQTEKYRRKRKLLGLRPDTMFIDRIGKLDKEA